MANNKNKKKSPFSIYWIYAVIAVAIIGFQLFMSTGANATVKSEDTFIELAKEGYIAEVSLVNRVRVDFTLTSEGKDFIRSSEEAKFKLMKDALNRGNQFGGKQEFSVKILDAGAFTTEVKEMNKELEAAGKDTVQVLPKEEINYISNILGFLLPIVILIVIWLFVMRRMSGGAGGGAGGQIFNVGKSKAKVYENGKSTNVTFNDVAGLEGAKEEIEEIVEFLKNSKKYTELGAKIPKGALLVGPPGTGKTLLAKAVAGEAEVPFFSMSGSDFVEMFVGVGASRVRDLFKQAKSKSPCIIFIDEIDAIGRARGKNPNMGSNDERENTLNQLLTEMDGFDTNSGVIILAATNRADILDRALMRAGRFDRQIQVELPDLPEREAIFNVHLRPIKLEDGFDVAFLAKQTPGFSGADIANVCNEAALIAARYSKKVVEKQDFLDAIDRIIGGLEKRNKIIKESERETIAYHEAGHATVSWLLEHAHPLVKVTIVPRGKALGAAWYLPQERQITTTEQMLDDMCSTLGGRAAEDISFKKISTGAQNDLEKVTKQAYAMVSIYGMSKKIGNVSYYDSTGQSDYSFSKPYSEKTAEAIDAESNILIETQYARAKEILTANSEGHQKLARLLLEKEVIFSDDLEKIFGKRPWDLKEEATKEEKKEDIQEEEKK